MYKFLFAGMDKQLFLRYNSFGHFHVKYFLKSEGSEEHGRYPFAVRSLHIQPVLSLLHRQRSVLTGEGGRKGVPSLASNL